VQALNGGCPNIRFVVSGTVIVADGNTKYPKDGQCGDVRPGVTVSVSGTTDPTGIVIANTINVKKKGDEGDQ
jgi:hypothetical protein